MLLSVGFIVDSPVELQTVTLPMTQIIAPIGCKIPVVSVAIWAVLLQKHFLPKKSVHK